MKKLKYLLIAILFAAFAGEGFGQCYMPAPIVTNASCGQNNGVISFTFQPGCSFEFDYGFGQVPNYSQGNFAPGTYLVDIYDMNFPQSVTQISVTVGNDPAPVATANITNTNCSSTCNGVIDVSVSSSVGIASYAWNNGQGSGSGAPVPITGLCVGTYIVTITDNNGCSIIEQYNIISANNDITYTTSSMDNECLGACNGFASVTASSPSGVSYLWNTSETTPDIHFLCDGTYTVTITNGSGCTAIHSFTINTNPPITGHWPQETGHIPGIDDRIKRVLTDKKGNIYVLCKFIDGAQVFPGMPVHPAVLGGPQEAFFVAKYDHCGDLLWFAYNENHFGNWAVPIDMEAIDLDFNDDESKVILFGKTYDYWGGYHYLESSSGSSIPLIQVPNKDVFSVDIDAVYGTYTTSDLNHFPLLFNNDYQRAQKIGLDIFIGGQVNNHAFVRKYTVGGNLMNSVIYDSETGNSVVDFEIDGSSMYTGLNVSNQYDLGNGVVLVNGNDALLAKSTTTSLLPPSIIKPANCTNIQIKDIEFEGVYSNQLTVVGQYKNSMPGWNPILNSSISSTIDNGYIIQFDQGLIPQVAYQLTNNGIISSSANAISIDPDGMIVAGTVNGAGGEIITSVQNAYSSASTVLSSPNGVNSMWVAKFDGTFPMVKWMLGSSTSGDMNVTTVAYNYKDDVFHVGGNFLENIQLGAFTNLNTSFPGRPVGFVIRGGEYMTPGAGAYYKKETEGVSTQTTDKTVTEPKLEIYPNPNKGNFTINFQHKTEGPIDITIMDVSGKIVYQYSSIKESYSFEKIISLQNIQTGFYMLKLVMDGQIEYQKIIIG